MRASQDAPRPSKTSSAAPGRSRSTASTCRDCSGESRTTSAMRSGGTKRRCKLASRQLDANPAVALLARERDESLRFVAFFHGGCLRCEPPGEHQTPAVRNLSRELRRKIDERVEQDVGNDDFKWRTRKRIGFGERPADPAVWNRVELRTAACALQRDGI